MVVCSIKWIEKVLSNSRGRNISVIKLLLPTYLTTCNGVIFIGSGAHGPQSTGAFNPREFPPVDTDTIENALREMRNSDSVLLVDCQLPNKSNEDKENDAAGDPQKYMTFANRHPESLECEGK